MNEMRLGERRDEPHFTCGKSRSTGHGAETRFVIEHAVTAIGGAVRSRRYSIR